MKITPETQKTNATYPTLLKLAAAGTLAVAALASCQQQQQQQQQMQDQMPAGGVMIVK